MDLELHQEMRAGAAGGADGASDGWVLALQKGLLRRCRVGKTVGVCMRWAVVILEIVGVNRRFPASYTGVSVEWYKCRIMPGVTLSSLRFFLQLQSFSVA